MTPKAGGPLKVALYRRISVEAGNGNGVSLDVQAGRLRSLAAAHGWQVAADYADDGSSGKSLDRPQMRQLLEDVKARPRPFEVVAVYSLSRLTRRVADLGAVLAEFDRRGVGLVSLTEGVDGSTPAGRLVLNVLASVAEWERQEIASRTSAALRHKRSQLQVYGGQVPFGFVRKGKKLEPVAAELAAVAQMLEMRRGGYSLRQIGGALEREAIRTKHRRKAWTAETIRGILSRADFYMPHLGSPPSERAISLLTEESTDGQEGGV